jgi:hypothetical protein
MLAVTTRDIFEIDPIADCGKPIHIVGREGIARAVEVQGLIVVALTSGDIELLWPAGTERIETGIDEPIESLLILDPIEPVVLIGTEGASLFRLAGKHVERLVGFDALPCRDQWHTPWGGPPAVRSLAATPEGWVFADIHVGSIMASADGGGSWRAVTPTLHEDVHQVATCVDAPRRVYANTADGVWISDDHGRTWDHRSDDLGNRYGRAVAAFPQNADIILASVSDGPHGEHVHGQLWRSMDAGRSWQHITAGFPGDTEANINTFHVAFSADGLGWVAVETMLYLSYDAGETWNGVWHAPEGICSLG